jgi:hypothetical protein
VAPLLVAVVAEEEVVEAAAQVPAGLALAREPVGEQALVREQALEPEQEQALVPEREAVAVVECRRRCR